MLACHSAGQTMALRASHKQRQAWTSSARPAQRSVSGRVVDAASRAALQRRARPPSTRSSALRCRALLKTESSSSTSSGIKSSSSGITSSTSSGITSSSSTSITTSSTSGGITTSSGALSDEASAFAALAASLAVGGVLGGVLGVGLDESLPGAAVQHASAALGWAYFSAWSLSFWPQILENQRTGDVSGLSPDYLLYSLLGYVSYAAYTAALCFDDGVRASYASMHGGALPDVSPADFAFAAHAVAATLVTSAQYVAMRQPGRDRSLSPVAVGVAATALAAVLGGAAHVSASCSPGEGCDAWLPVLVLLGGLKVTCTLIKYTPQVLHNHARRSTDGWNLANVLLDLAGGALSLSQVVLDAVARQDLEVVTGSPAKLWIAVLSLGYDFVFIAQEFWWYRDDDGGGDKKKMSNLVVEGDDGVSSGGGKEPGAPVPVAVAVAVAEERAGRHAAAASLARATSSRGAATVLAFAEPAAQQRPQQASRGRE